MQSNTGQPLLLKGVYAGAVRARGASVSGVVDYGLMRARIDSLYGNQLSLKLIDLSGESDSVFSIVS